jgi:uncharacterized protein (DUF433 family)
MVSTNISKKEADRLSAIEAVPVSTAEAVRSLLSLREGLVLAEVSEKNVRKDIESGWLSRRVVSEGHRLWFRWIDVFLLAGVYRNRLLSATLRKRAWERVDKLDWAVWHAANFSRRFSKTADLFENYLKEGSPSGLEIDDYVVIDFKKVFEDLSPRVDLYAKGLRRIEEKDSVLSGKAVFKGSRLSVTHVGKMFERGESLANILEDYPYLTEDDVRFAALYHRAHPPLGRPRANVENPDDVDSEFAAG